MNDSREIAAPPRVAEDVEWTTHGFPADDDVQRFADVVHAALMEVGYRELAFSFAAYVNDDGSFYAEPFDDLNPEATQALERAEAIARQAS